MGVSLLFPAFNRLEFTKQSWVALMQNTDWSLVDEFHVYDDGSDLAAKVWLKGQACTTRILMNVNVSFQDTEFRSPMGVTRDWIRRSRAPMLAKLDNDTIYSPHWLNIALDVMARHPELDMLGLECMREPVRWDAKWRGGAYVTAGDLYQIPGTRGEFEFGYLPAVFISGLGLYRREAFAQSLPEDNGYFGLEEWQQAQQHLKYGWILPSLPTILLDRLPMDPWKSLSEEYVRKGWQRPWSLELRYKPEQHEMWDWWRPIE